MTQSAQAYSMKLANQLTKITMEKFFKEIHNRFYSDQDVSFMEYFLELTQHEGEFVVEHTDLKKYGIMTSTRSGDILDKLNQLNLENDKDFTLRDISQRGTSGTQTHKVYYLTPDAFKLALISAKRYKGQTTDPIIYRRYYLLLEKVFKLYTDYERQYAKCLLAIKDDKIDSLTAKIDQQSLEFQEILANSRHIISQNNNLSTQVTDLHAEVNDLHAEVNEVNNKLTALFDFMLSFARVTIPTWIGSSIIKQQYNTLSNNKGQDYALKHLKVMFMVGFYIRSPHPLNKYTKVIDGKIIQFKARGYMKIYSDCTNFENIGKRLKELYERHGSTMCMFMAKAITMISCEINSERIILENAGWIFPDYSVVEWDKKFKSFDLAINTIYYSNANNIFKKICDNATKLRFQDYQQRIDQFDEATDMKLDPKIINYIDEVDNEFFSATRPFIQKFIDSYQYKFVKNGKTVRYFYNVSSRKCQVRNDLNQMNLTTNEYALRKLEVTINEHSSIDHIDYMTTNGILSKEDLPALRSIAKYNNIDTTELDEQLEEYQDELNALGKQ